MGSNGGSRHSARVGASASMSSRPTLVVYPNGKSTDVPKHIPRLRFLIMDAPRESNLHVYIQECTKNGVTDIVRVCEPTYHNIAELKNAGITLHDLAYDDGTSPPDNILNSWLDIVEERFVLHNASTLPNDIPPTVAVHCIAGLGRAPVLVAIALMEFCRCDAAIAVKYIRDLRRGAINRKQLTYLQDYKCRRQTSSGACCMIS